jgi:hypothetical protein
VFDPASGALVGVAFSGLMNSNNIGYIIPLPVLHSFLLNFRRNGVYTGKCSDCFEIQSMENAALRRRFGVAASGPAAGQQGVMLSRIPPESAVHGLLQVRAVHAVPCCAVLCCAMLCCAMLCHAVLCHAVIMLCCAML